MYPDLSYLLNDLVGTPVDNWTSIVKTFGLFLVIAFLTSHFFLAKELKRKEEEGLINPSKIRTKVGFPPTTGEIILNSLLGFFLGFKVVYLIRNYQEIGNDIIPFLVSTDGNWGSGLIGAIIFGGLYYYNRQKQKLSKPHIKETIIHPYQRTGDITIRAAISGIIGAKLFALFESIDTIKAFFADPIGQFFSGSGLAIYGGLIIAFIYVYWYVSKKNITPIHAMDAVAPALMIGYAVGRIGCQLSGDGDWGIVNTLEIPGWWFLPEWLWSYDYPRNVLQQGSIIEGCEGEYCRRLVEGVYPTPAYETIVGIMLFLILWALRKRIHIAGMLFFIYLILNGLERFFIEKIRVNEKLPLLGMQLTQAEIISFLLFFAGIVGCTVLWLRHRKGKLRSDST